MATIPKPHETPCHQPQTDASRTGVVISSNPQSVESCVSTKIGSLSSWIGVPDSGRRVTRSAGFFAHAAAYGDIIAAILALLSLRLLSSAAGIVAAWIFSLWGSADIFNAFYQANHAGLLAGQLGAAFFLPTLMVPLLLTTHGLAFRILPQHNRDSATKETRQSAQRTYIALSSRHTSYAIGVLKTITIAIMWLLESRHSPGVR